MKLTTRARLRTLVAAEPQLTRSDLARRLGVTRERIRQLVRAEGLAVPLGVPGPATGPANAPPPVSRLITGGVPVRLSATVVGSVGELLAAADLMTRGFFVFFPLVRTARCDLLTLDRDGRVEQIEVRCGHRSGTRIVWGGGDRSKSDRRAVILTGEPVHYAPPFPF